MKFENVSSITPLNQAYFIFDRIDQGHLQESLDVLVLPVSAFLENLVQVCSTAACATLLLSIASIRETSFFLWSRFAFHLNSINIISEELMLIIITIPKSP